MAAIQPIVYNSEQTNKNHKKKKKKKKKKKMMSASWKRMSDRSAKNGDDMLSVLTDDLGRSIES